MNDDYREPSLWKIALDINTYWDPFYWQTVKEDVVSGAARDRIAATGLAYIGIIAGAGQMIYGAKKPSALGTAVAAHGFGNYLGSIGNLSNTIYGTNYDWNYTRKGYEKTSEMLLSDAKYGKKAFFGVDAIMGLIMFLKPVRINTTFLLGNGPWVRLECSKRAHSFMIQPAPTFANDAFSIYISGNEAWE
jgi:hypothetical protein